MGRPLLVRLARAAVCVAAVCGGCAHGTPQSAPASPRPPITTGAYPEYGRSPNFSWIAGRLARRFNGCTYLVFGDASHSQWGGRIALIAPPDLLSRFQDGGMIVATGRLSRAPQGECGAPAYEADTVAAH